MSKVTVSIAAKLTGKSRETINKATRNNKLSFSRDASNRKVIDVAELERVYDLVKTIDEINQPSEPVNVGQPSSESDTNAELVALREKLTSNQKMYETLVAEREREREQLEGQIEDLRESVKKYQEQHSKALLLITDQSEQANKQVEDWEKTIEILKKQAVNNKRQVTRIEQALEEQSKSFLQKIFG